MLRLFYGALRGLLFSTAFLLVALTIVGRTYVPETEIPADLAGTHVRLQGLPFRVLQAGHGPEVFLIHGSPGSVEDWAPVMDALKSEFHVTAYDRPGNGYSADTGDYSLAQNAEVALTLMQTLKLKHVTVVGHSYGGATALAMALRNPPMVKSYVVIDSATYTPSRAVTPTYRLLTVPGLGIGLARAFGSQLAEAKIRAGILEQFNGHSPGEAFLSLRTRIWSSAKVAHTIAEETVGAAAFLAAQSPRYPSIHAPVHILAEADNAFRRGSAEHLHADIKGSTLQLIPATGHYIQFEKTAEVVTAIRKAAR
jgi:pimeloyl-ACP methyl ester carboxylesterase